MNVAVIGNISLVSIMWNGVNQLHLWTLVTAQHHKVTFCNI